MPSTVIPPATTNKKRMATHTPEAANAKYINLEATPDVEVHTVPTSRQAAAKRKTKTKTAPKPNGRRNHTGGKKWTGADLEALFAAVLVLGDGPTMRSLEGKVEGRTAKQCYDTWK